MEANARRDEAGGIGDEHGIRRRIREELFRVIGHPADSALLCDRLSGFRLDIGDGGDMRIGNTERKVLRVYFANAPRSDDPGPNYCVPHFIASLFLFANTGSRLRRYSRLRLALSSGVPMPGSTSCSTST